MISRKEEFSCKKKNQRNKWALQRKEEAGKNIGDGDVNTRTLLLLGHNKTSLDSLFAIVALDSAPANIWPCMIGTTLGPVATCTSVMINICILFENKLGASESIIFFFIYSDSSTAVVI